jgi:RNA polymerase sigma-70 factor (ECF subfamily)
MASLQDDRFALFEAGAAAHPGIFVGARAFSDYLADRSPAAEPLLEHAGDVYLACACALGAPRAAEAFERLHGPTMAKAIARVDGTRAIVEDTLQSLRMKLLVPHDGKPARIAEYSGRAPLKNWLAVIAMRAAIDARRSAADRPHAALEAGEDVISANIAPELELIRRRYKRELEDAIRDAVSGLTARERLVLRMNLVEGVGVTRLGDIYRVSRATAARWVVAARERLFERTCDLFCERQNLTRAEFASLAPMLQSQLEVSLLERLSNDA